MTLVLDKDEKRKGGKGKGKEIRRS